MEVLNFTITNSITFILSGIPGLEDKHIWISIPFFIFYVISLFVNVMLLFVVAKEPTLHKPMYLLICMLVLTDFGTSACLMPKTLSILWFKLNVITLDGCLTQMFIFHTLNGTHSVILVTMAFDRYVAICNPMRYATILTNGRVAKLGLAGLIRTLLLVLPLPIMLRSQPFCASRIIPHTYCEFMSVVKLSCADITVNQTYAIMITFVFGGLDLTLIGISYGFIFQAVFKISSKKALQKALSTCTAHLWVIFVTYVPFFFFHMIHKFGQVIPIYVHILLANFYLVFPHVFNPIIYGVKTKELREKLGKYTCRL